MQYILTDLPLGHNIQTVRMNKGMTQEEVVAKTTAYGKSYLPKHSC